LRSLDPVWTVKNGSLFLLPLTAEELFSGEGLICEVFDFDKFGKNDKLGLTTVPPKVLYNGTGERLEFKLMPPKGKTETSGAIAIRVRHATDYDKKFMAEVDAGHGKKHHINRLDEMKIKAHAVSGGKGDIRSILSHNVKTEKHGEDKGQTKYKVRPGPDPKRVEETTWMSEEKIEQEVVKESRDWIDTGSGDLGRVYVEILSCDGLPNLDTGGFLGNKTDTFVCTVFEDTVIMTDIIDDCLAPRWLPWSKRAFVFHMMHSSSALFLGVFDFDPGLDDHDLIGRVTVDLANLQKDTTYDLTYSIFPTARMTERKSNGRIRVRVRLEVDDERKMMLSTLEPPPTIYVNVKTKKEWRLVRYTCQGKYDMDAYSMKVINSYVEELLAFQNLLYYVQDALIALLLWRGTFSLTIAGHNVKLPLHSINAFISFVVLVEKPRLLPSFYFACIGWFLLAVMGFRNNIPDPWMKCKSFRQFLEILIVGDSVASPDRIDAYQNAEESAKWQEEAQQRIIATEEAARVKYEEQTRQQEEEMRELEEAGGGDTDITTKTGSGMMSSIDVFKPFLYPIQQYLGLAVGYVRVTRNIVVWEECYITFWITLGSFILSVAFIFVPWAFIMKWSARLIVWTLFGPWMKLVDIFYYSKITPLSEEEQAAAKWKSEILRREKRQAAVTEARMKRENAMKLKAMKKIMFGKFVTKVPVLKEDRHHDTPLAESAAVPFVPKQHSLAELAMKEAGYHHTRLPGQHLVGDMIPKVSLVVVPLCVRNSKKLTV
jgi:hypothetical protein